MNEINDSSTFMALLSSTDQITLFLSVIGILIFGAVITALIAETDKLFPNMSHSGKSHNAGNTTINRKLYLPALQGDKFGFNAEHVLDLIQKEFNANKWRGWRTDNDGAPFQVVTGLSDDKTKSQIAINSTHPVIQITMNGSVKNNELNLRFYPQGPLHYNDQEEAQPENILIPKAQTRGKKEKSFFYECADFPLFELKTLKLTAEQNKISRIEEVLLKATIAGLMSRGVGIESQIVSSNKLEKWASELDEFLMSDLSTDQSMNGLQTECLTVAAWAYLVSGLSKKSEINLKRSLELHQYLSSKNWEGREPTEKAGAGANEAFAAYALMQLNPEDPNYPSIIKKTVFKALRTFRPESYPQGWGKLICKLAFAKTTSDERHLAEQIEQPESKRLSEGQQVKEEKVTSSSDENADKYQTYHSIELALDKAIELWRKDKNVQNNREAVCEAYFAKGKLALSNARLNMGVQELERAENGFLASLALSDDTSKPAKRPFFKITSTDIRNELGHLYLAWGTRFGEAELIEKAIHHFSTLLEREECLSKAQLLDTKYALAECQLNYSGLTNKKEDHAQAIYSFNDVLDEGIKGERQEKVEQSIAVARARLALISHKKEEVKMAISSICSVIGQNGKLWPTKDVLLRLRARLRELLFTLEGEGIALDRAINDRRELVKLAEGGVQDIRWAVEVGDLVRLLSKRQYKSGGQSQDFHEAHYLLETAIAITEKQTSSKEGATSKELEISHIRGSFYITMAKLLSSFARLHLDEQALREASTFYQKYIDITPRAINPKKRAEVLSQIGLIMMDLSEQYGSHTGLKQAIATFAEAHDIYLEIGLIDLSNRMRRFLENAQAAELAYRPPSE